MGFRGREIREGGTGGGTWAGKGKGEGGGGQDRWGDGREG